MTQLEQTIAERARAHLAGLQAFYAKAKAGTAVSPVSQLQQGIHGGMVALVVAAVILDSGASLGLRVEGL